MADFTPGPWDACKQGNCSCGQIWSLPADQPVATANTKWGDDLENPYGEIPSDQMHANARLIAAAPDLLAALEMMRSWGCPACCGDCGSANPPVISCPTQIINAAIAKATQSTFGREERA